MADALIESDRQAELEAEANRQRQVRKVGRYVEVQKVRIL